ncbi:ABC transporter ATP-binding protein [Halohasta salina]|uniref:ABC transporter ATP-binding protein n=1 Tax=Halohasta salina TaxID=2961621 RepID=UPI0020A558BA|nr:ABC transporter ATP-binding protein [Halohasta salina]
MTDEMISRREQFRALLEVARYRPKFTASIVALGVVVAVLEGVGLGFIYPIIQVTQGNTEASGGLVGLFARAYDFVGIPFTLQYIILGVGSILAVRYTFAFVIDWLTAKLRMDYMRYLRTETFENALDARIAYFDKKGSDEMLNAIITQTQYAASTIRRIRRALELSLISLAYVLVAVALSPVLMLASIVVLGGFMLGIRRVLESGFSVGSKVASANERVQESVQAGMQGIRDVKAFNLHNELFGDFGSAVNQHVVSLVRQRRNQAIINNFNQFMTAATVFALIFVGIEVVNLSVGVLGVFLFAMFRLGPKLSNLNDVVYTLENDLPHLVRTQTFVTSLKNNREDSGEASVPAPMEEISFNHVDFSYETTQEQVLDGVCFNIERGEFVAFAGPSGAGKSTIVSLLIQMYTPDSGTITADGKSINQFEIHDWRSRVSLVRQNPFIFNDTLRYNLTIGNRDATDEEIDSACRIAKVDEFLDDLPAGYDTVLGDNGVRLSGGQKQRVAIARAILKDADFLVLDEATSDLDSHLESDVHKAIEAMDRDYGIIAIAHRLSTITDADRIYMMEDGSIVESGEHGTLVEHDEKYANLYAAQSQTG